MKTEKDVKYVMAVLSCVDTSLHMETLEKGVHYLPQIEVLNNETQNEEQILREQLKTKKIDYYNFSCWGYFDILELMVFDRSADFITLQQLIPYKHTYNHSYYLGAFLNYKNFSFSEISSFPLFGFTTLKFKSEFFSSLENKNYKKFWKEIFPDKLNCLIGKNKMKYILAWSFGWEDAFLILFDSSYENIKKIIYKIRTLEFSDFSSLLVKNFRKEIMKEKQRKERKRHCCVFTYTILGITSPDISQDIDFEKTLKNTKNKIKNDHFWVDNIKLRTHPGHVDWVLRRFPKTDNKQRAEGVFPSVCPGRNDVHIRFDQKTDFSRFIDKYIKYIVPIFKNPKSPVIHAETHFRCEGKNWESKNECYKGRKNLEGIHSEIDKEIMKYLYSLSTQQSLLSKTLILSFQNLVATIRFFENHYLVKDTLHTFCIPFNKYFIEKKIYEAIKKGFINNLVFAINTVSQYIPIVLIDRFGGSLPVGETKLGYLNLYKGGIQKFLWALDFWAFEFFEKLIACLSKSKGSDFVQTCYFNFYIRNISTPLIEPKGNYSPIVIRFEDLFTPNLLYSVIHEIGHLFWNRVDEFILKESRSIKNFLTDISDEKFKKAIKDNLKFLLLSLYIHPTYHFFDQIRADYFCCILGFKHIKSWEKVQREIFTRLGNDRSKSSEQVEERIKNLKWFVSLLNNQNKNGKLPCSSFFKEFIHNLEKGKVCTSYLKEYLKAEIKITNEKEVEKEELIEKLISLAPQFCQLYFNQIIEICNLLENVRSEVYKINNYRIFQRFSISSWMEIIGRSYNYL